MLTLVLTRHGLTDRSEPEQHLGQRIDISINAAGRRQAEALAQRLSAVRFDRVITSPLFRARETGEIIAPRRRVETDPRLKEMDYGAWEGLTLRADRGARRRGPARVGARPGPPRMPGRRDGQRRRGPRARRSSTTCIDEHKAWHAKARFRAATNPGGARRPRSTGPILVVGHSSTNRVLLCVALGTDVRDYRKRFVQGQAQPDRPALGGGRRASRREAPRGATTSGTCAGRTSCPGS